MFESEIILQEYEDVVQHWAQISAGELKIRKKHRFDVLLRRS